MTPVFYKEGERSDPRKHGTLSVTLPFLHDLYRPRVEAQRSAGHIGARSLWSEIVSGNSLSMGNGFKGVLVVSS